MPSISDILERLGPCLSSRLSTELCAVKNIKAAAARKQIERAKLAKQILSVQGIKFQHNEQFLYTKKQERTKQLQAALLDALLGSRSAYRLPMLGVQARGGLIPSYLFPTFSGFPLLSRENRQDCNSALSHLIKSELLVHNVHSDTISMSSSFAPHPVSETRHHARLVGEDLLLLAVKDWCRLQGLLTFEKVSLRGPTDCPQFGFFQWDLVGPSYVAPLCHFSGEGVIPGFVVVDVILGRKLSRADVTPFIHKSMTIRSNPNNRPFLAMLIADWFEKDALQDGRKMGLLFTTPKNLFNVSLAELIDDFTQAFEQKKKFLEAKPDYLHKILMNLGMIGHLQGAYQAASKQLFFLLLDYCYNRLRKTSAIYNRSLKLSGAVDLYLETDNEAIACQCIWKESNALVQESESLQWIESLPQLLKSLTLSKKQQTQALICTNRQFTPAAIARLREASVLHPIAWLDGPTLRTLLEPLNPDLNQDIPETILDPITETAKV